MTVAEETLDSADASPPSRGALARWLLLCSVLPLEVLVLTLRFDTASLGGTNTWSTRVLARAHLLPQIATCVVAALLVLGGSRLRNTVRELVQLRATSLVTGLLLVVQLLSFGGLWYSTWMVLEKDRGSMVWAGLWLVTAALTALLYLATLAPLRVVSDKILRNRRGVTAVVVVGLMTWGAGRVAQFFWIRQSADTLGLVLRLLELRYERLVVVPLQKVVGAEAFSVRITPECSGFEGMGVMGILLAVFLWVHRDELRFPRALVLFPMSIGILWTFNALRIAALIAFGVECSPRGAVQGFHSQAGWLAFAAIATGLLALVRRVPWFGAAPSGELETAAGEQETAVR